MIFTRQFFTCKWLLIVYFFAQIVDMLHGSVKNLRPIGVGEIVAYAKIDKYYQGREKYLGKVIEIINDQIIGKGLPFNSVLELGPYKLPIVEGADVMDKNINLVDIKYKQDATKIPWPIKDKAYDLFIALQVWEHLGNRQKEAFKEVMRISKMAILSFPYKWTVGHQNHLGIDEKVISEWTLGVKPVFTEIVSRRAIYFFIFDQDMNHS